MMVDSEVARDKLLDELVHQIELAEKVIKAVGIIAERHELALRRIAAFDDEGANKRLADTGSFSSFDEPCAVQIAREALNG